MAAVCNYYIQNNNDIDSFTFYGSLNGLKGVDKSLDLSWLEGIHTALKKKNSNALDRQNFDRLLASDVMATDKLVEGIKLFQNDSHEFERMIFSDDLGKTCAAKT